MPKQHVDPLRLVRGQLLAELDRHITKTTFGDRTSYNVPSASDRNASYNVFVDEDGQWICQNCPDFANRQLPCKHIFEVLLRFYPQLAPKVPTDLLEKGRKAGGLYATARSLPKQPYIYESGLAEATRRDKALMMQHTRFEELCQDLKAVLDSRFPSATGRGRREMSAGDKAFVMLLRAQHGDSMRKFASTQAALVVHNKIKRSCCKTTLIRYLKSAKTTAILLEAYKIVISVFREMETEFYIDSTGFSPFFVSNWCDSVYSINRDRPNTQWFKLHAVMGGRSHAILGFLLTPKEGDGTGDSTNLRPLVKWLAENGFTNREFVVADNAYIWGTECFDAAKEYGMRLVGPFKGRNFHRDGTIRPDYSELHKWASRNSDKVDELCRRRSAIEGLFSAEKREDNHIAAIGTAEERANPDLNGFYISRQNEMLIRMIRQVMRATIAQELLLNRPGMSYSKKSAFSHVREYSRVETTSHSNWEQPGLAS